MHLKLMIGLLYPMVRHGNQSLGFLLLHSLIVQSLIRLVRPGSKDNTMSPNLFPPFYVQNPDQPRGFSLNSAVAKEEKRQRKENECYPTQKALTAVKQKSSQRQTKNMNQKSKRYQDV